MFEQYKMYASELGNIGSRYAATNSFYMTILAAITGLLGLTEGSKPLHEMGSLAGVLLPAFAAVVCMVWSKTIAAYRRTFAAKFEVLREMELKLDFATYTVEKKKLRPKSGLIANEQNIPIILSVLYAVLAVGLLVAGIKSLV